MYDTRPMARPSQPPLQASIDSSPIWASREGPAALCLHGLTGTPYEVAPVAHALSATGFSVSAPLLAGHGSTAAALAATRWQDWLASAEAAFDRLQDASDGGPVAVLGSSMGGLLALRLARLHPERVAALVLLAVPLRLRRRESWAIKFWRGLPPFVRRGRLASLPKRNGSDVTDERVRRENPCLPEIPIASVAQMLDLAELVRHDLAFVHQPALVVHGERDHTVHLGNSYELAGSLASDLVEHLWLPRSGHLVGVDVERSELAAAVVRFLRQSSQRQTAAVLTRKQS